MAYLIRIREAAKSFIAKVLGIKTFVEPEAEPEAPPVKETWAQKPPGLDCPQCSFRMMISVPMLLAGDPAICPACGLQLAVDREQSRGCLNELQKVYDAVQRVEAVKTRH
jgi:hypothetical protein